MEQQVEMLLRGGQFRHLLESQIQAVREQYGLKKIDVEILFYLSRNRQHNTAKEMQQSLHLNKGHISQAMDGLCRRGLVTAETDPEDRRYVHYSTTEPAAKIVQDVSEAWQRMNGIIFEGITEEETETLRRVAEKINGNIERMLENR